MVISRSFFRSVSTFVASVFLAAGMVACSDHSSSDDKNTTGVSAQTLESAASFLGAASGKETPLSIDSVVFVNSALGINHVSSDPVDLYGDLWVLKRDPYGVPLRDESGCVEPVSSETVTWPDGTEHDTVPMVLEEFQDGSMKCSVVEGYEQYTIELEIGRLNMIRTMGRNPDVFGRALAEVIKNINAAKGVKTDPAGRLILVTEENGVDVEKTIDSPRENIALYMALMKEGRIAGYGPSRTVDGVKVPPQWQEIRKDLNMGNLVYLRDGTPGYTGGVKLIKGYADLSLMRHSRQQEYSGLQASYIQYVADADCKYQDMEGDVWTRVFGEKPYDGSNIAAFTERADDSRRIIVFMHNVIQDMPDTGIATLPKPAGDRIDEMEAAASFLGAASNKGVPLTVDSLVFINTVLGLNDVSFDYKGEIYGDLYQLLRDDNGEPILDGNGCPEPISSQGGTVPMNKDETGECVIAEGYEDDVIEVELGRLSVVRVALTNPRILDRQLYDVVNSINNSQGVKLEVTGRLAYTVEGSDGPVDKTVDSPLANLALYRALMKWGKIDGTVEIMEDGTWVTKPIQITLDDAVLNEEGLGYLKHGNAACQADPQKCGVKRTSGGYVDYSGFTHNSQEDYGGVDVHFVERQDDLSCGYVDKTESVWERVLGGDSTEYTSIAAFVDQAEDTRKIIQFTHNVIQDPVTTP